LYVLRERLMDTIDILADRVSPGLAQEATLLYCGPDWNLDAKEGDDA